EAHARPGRLLEEQVAHAFARQRGAELGVLARHALAVVERERQLQQIHNPLAGHPRQLDEMPSVVYPASHHPSPPASTGASSEVASSAGTASSGASSTDRLGL